MVDLEWWGWGDLSPGRTATNSLFLRMHIEGLTRLGVDLDGLLSQWGVPAAALDDMPDWVDRLWTDRLWCIAEQLSGDSAIGLRLAHRARGELEELVSSVVQRSRDLRGALEQLCRFGRVLDGSLDFALERERDMVVMLQRPRPGLPPPRQSAEHVLAVLVLIGRQLTGTGLRAREVHFQHPPVEHREALEAHLGGRVEFDAMYTALILDERYLDLPLVDPDDRLRLRLRREDDALLRALPDDHFLTQVRAAVEHSLARGAPGGRGLASSLGLSEATLRARLRMRGTSLRLLTDAVRRDLALAYLHARELSIGQVAARLGYRDPTTFGRAFRRWVGCTPQQYLVTH